MKFGYPVWYGDLRERSLEYILSSVKASGFDFIELSLEYPIIEKQDKSELKPLFKKHGLAIGFHSPLNDASLLNPRETMRKASVNVIKQCIDFAADLEGIYMNFHVLGGERWKSFPEIDDEQHKAGFNSCAEIADYAEDAGVQAVLENHPSIFFGTPQELEATVLKLPHLKLCFDFGHFMQLNKILESQKGLQKIDIFEAAERLSKFVFISHIHDYIDETNRDHRILGSGSLDYMRIFSLIKSEYNVLEIFHDKNFDINLKAAKESMDLLLQK